MTPPGFSAGRKTFTPVEISKVTFSTRSGEKNVYIPSVDPDLVENIFGSQRQRITAIEPLGDSEATFQTLLCASPSARDVTDIFQALGQLFSLGVDPVGSLNLLIRRNSNIKLANILLEVSQSIQQGEPIADAFALHKNVFGETAVHLIRAGAATGNLGDAFQNLADNMTKAQSIAGKVKGALIYPVAILIVIYIVVCLFAFMVIPKLSQIYDTMGGELPLITQFFQQFSVYLNEYPWLVGVGPALAFVGWQLKDPIAKSPAFNKLLRVLPGIKGFVWKKNLTQVCSTLSLLLESGLPLTDSLEFSSRVVSDPALGNIFMEIRERLEGGELVNEAFGDYIDDLGPDGPRLITAVEVGDSTGNLAPLISKIAKSMEEEFDLAAQNLNRLLEPIVIVILTVVVGTIVFAVYYPIFTLGQKMMDQK